MLRYLVGEGTSANERSEVGERSQSWPSRRRSSDPDLVPVPGRRADRGMPGEHPHSPARVADLQRDEARSPQVIQVPRLLSAPTRSSATERPAGTGCPSTRIDPDVAAVSSSSIRISMVFPAPYSRR